MKTHQTNYQPSKWVPVPRACCTSHLQQPAGREARCLCNHQVAAHDGVGDEEDRGQQHAGAARCLLCILHLCSAAHQMAPASCM
jgi:hypothetical protein